MWCYPYISLIQFYSQIINIDQTNWGVVYRPEVLHIHCRIHQCPLPFTGTKPQSLASMLEVVWFSKLT